MTHAPIPDVPVPDDRLLTTKEVCDRLNCQRSVLDKWRAEGRIESVPFGDRALRYRKSDIDAIIANGLPEPREAATV